MALKVQKRGCGQERIGLLEIGGILTPTVHISISFVKMQERRMNTGNFSGLASFICFNISA